MTLVHTINLSEETIESIKADYESEAEEYRELLDEGVADYEGQIDRLEQGLEDIEQKIHELTIDLRETENG